ncbi:MAG: aminotransferase class V-fold PLP-dependent enzyme [Fimbriimonadaceae bacterium]|nr:aminotransferase class V-fold PLP-dependent enzyme [Fimbriimonadaceae bacterium]
MNAPPSTPVSIDQVRARFPGLQTPFAFLENAGGSQLPDSVIAAMDAYFRTSFVQLGAAYPASDRATETVDEAHRFMTEFVGGTGIGHAMLGPSTSALMQMLAQAYADVLAPGDEVVVAANGHESNVGPWVRLERRGLVPRLWGPDATTGESTLEGLDRVLTPKTKIVALCHVSNLLGGILDLAPIVERAHAVGARLVVDGVAYAPHRAVDVRDLGVDWYGFSNYKVFGPHMATLFGTHEVLGEIDGPNHFFVPRDSGVAKFELGGVNHEGCAGLLGLRPYLNFLIGRDAAAAVDHGAVRQAYAVMAGLEGPPTARLVEWLQARRGVRIVGPNHAGPDRVATVSFVHDTQPSSEIAKAVNRQGIGIRHGHMYSHRLCQALGLDLVEGVVRVSMAHYNSVKEVERLLEVLERVT